MGDSKSNCVSADLVSTILKQSLFLKQGDLITMVDFLCLVCLYLKIVREVIRRRIRVTKRLIHK